MSELIADGGFVTNDESVAVSSDQQAIIIRNGREISMTLSTEYSGDGDDFGWIIPTTEPPDILDISEAGVDMTAVFDILDYMTAPKIPSRGSGGCFPSGTEVQTVEGLYRIDSVPVGMLIYSFDLSTGEWEYKPVLKRLTHRYSGDMIDIRIGESTVTATGNHPFFVLSGDDLNTRPHPADIPDDETPVTVHGRWVEARALRINDELMNSGGDYMVITGLKSRLVNTEVFNLNIEGNHNFTVDSIGVLVHNKGGAEDSNLDIEVLGTVLLDHYEVSIIRAANPQSMLNWLIDNDFSIGNRTGEVLDRYIDLSWSFVAIKLRPGIMRTYQSEFLPPITIRYASDELIFPLYISSVSTTAAADITLYVFAESTVSSSNFPTKQLDYNSKLSHNQDTEKYFDTRIREETGPEGSNIIVLWSGLFEKEIFEEISYELFGENSFGELIYPFDTNRELYLTRLEARMDPEAVDDDIVLVLGSVPAHFEIQTYWPNWDYSIGVKTEAVGYMRSETSSWNFAIDFLLSYMFYPEFFLPAFGVEAFYSVNPEQNPGSQFFGLDLMVNLLLISFGPSFAMELTPDGYNPYLGFRIRFISFPPMLSDSTIGIGFDFLPISLRWSLTTGRIIFSIGLLSLHIGHFSGNY